MKWLIILICYFNFIKIFELEWSRCYNNDWYNWIWVNRFDKFFVGIFFKFNGNIIENKFKFLKNIFFFFKSFLKILIYYVNFRFFEFIFLRNKVYFVSFVRMIWLMMLFKKLLFFFYRKIYLVNCNCFVRLFVKNIFKYWFY